MTASSLASPLASLDVAIAWVAANTSRRPAEIVPSAAAAGRVLTEDLRAPHPMPMADRAALDGFAVKAGHRSVARQYGSASSRRETSTTTL